MKIEYTNLYKKDDDGERAIAFLPSLAVWWDGDRTALIFMFLWIGLELKFGDE